MNALTVIAVHYLTLLVTNEIDYVNGMPSNTEGQTQSKSANSLKTGTRSYAGAVQLGPRPPEEEKGPPSKIAIQNQRKRDRRKMKKAIEESSQSSSIRDREEESVTKESSSKPESKTEAQTQGPKGRSPISPKQLKFDQSTQNELATEDFPALSSHTVLLSQKKSRPNRTESKSDKKEIKMPEGTKEEELGVISLDHLEERTSTQIVGDKEAQDESVSLVLTSHSIHDEPRNSKMKSNQKETDPHPRTQSQRFDRKQGAYMERKTLLKKVTEKDIIQDESRFQPAPPSESAKPTFDKKTTGPRRIELGQDEVKLDYKRREPYQTDHQERSTLFTKNISDKGESNKSVPLVLTVNSTNNELRKSEWKNNDEKKIDELKETQSQKSEGKQPTSSEKGTLSTNVTGNKTVLDELGFQPASPPKSVDEGITGPDGSIELKRDKTELDYKKKELYLPPSKRLGKPFNPVEEAVSQMKAPVQERTGGQFHQGRVESSRTEVRRNKWEMPEHVHREPSKIPPYKFVNSEAYLLKAQEWKNVWQKKESYKSRKNEKIKEIVQKQNHSQTSSSIDKEFLSQQTQGSELEQNKSLIEESSLQQEMNATSLKEYEDEIETSVELEKSSGDISPLEKKTDESTNKESSLPASETDSIIIANIQLKLSSEQKQGDISSSILPKTEIEFKEGSVEELLNSRVSMQTSYSQSKSLSLLTENTVLPESRDVSEATHPFVVKTIMSDRTELTAPLSHGDEEENNEIELPGKKQNLLKEKTASTRSTMNASTAEDQMGRTLSHTEIEASEKEEALQNQVEKSRQVDISTPIVLPGEISNNFTFSYKQIASPGSRELEEIRIDSVPIDEAPTSLQSLMSNIVESVPETVLPNENTQGFLALLKEIGIIHSEAENKQEISKQHNIVERETISESPTKIEPTKDHITTDLFQSQIIKENKEGLTEEKKPHPFTFAPERKTLTNTLLVIFTVNEALVQLEQSTIDPMVFEATNIMTLQGSGVIVKFDSSEGVYGLQKAILDIENLSNLLQVKTTYFSKHLLCVHDIPKEVLSYEIIYRIKSQYHEEPISIQFVPYSLSFKDTYKIALFDVSDSLLDSVKKNPQIKVRWMLRRVEVCLSPDQDSYSHLHKINDVATTSTEHQLINEAVILKVPQNITMAEVNRSIFKKYKERPHEIRFDPYLRSTQMKMVTLRVSQTLLRKIFLSPNIQIRWSERTILTSMIIDRCTRCQRLGHLSFGCQGKAHPPASLHEDCLDCTLYNNDIPKFMSGIPQTLIQPHNTSHATDSVECPTKFMYIMQYLQQRSNIAKSICQNEPCLKGSELKIQTVKTPQHLEEPFPRQSQLQDHTSLTTEEPPSFSKSKLSQQKFSTSISPASKNSANISLDGGKSLTAYLQEKFSGPSTLYNSTLENIPKHPAPDASKMEFVISAQGHNLHEHDKEPEDSFTSSNVIIEDMVLNETAGSRSPSDLLKKQIIFEAVRQTVSETLNEVLPSFYKTILEAVDESVQETLTRLLPSRHTPSVSYETCNSQDWSSVASDDEYEPEDREKGKEKVPGDDVEEYDISPKIDTTSEGYDERNIVLVTGKSKTVNVCEELANIDINWKRTCIERSVIHSFERILLICKSTEGAKYLRSVIKKSLNLKVLM